MTESSPHSQSNKSENLPDPQPLILEGDKTNLHVHQSLKAEDRSQAIGNNQTIEIKIFHHTYTVSPIWLLATIGVSVLIILLAILGSTSWISARGIGRQPEKMTAILRVAVAGFSIYGSEDNGLGNAIGQELANNLDRALSGADLEFSHEVWGPDRVGTIRGNTQEERVLFAQQIAEKYDALIVVYGTIDTNNASWWITPEFFIEGLSFKDALEITGQHELGKPFPISGYGDDASRLALSSLLASRAKPFANLAIGIAFYATHKFDRAYQELITIENEAMWPDDIGGKQLLYLLLGNISGRLKQLSQAEKWYQQALNIQPSYSRAYAGLGNIYFSQALNGMMDTEDFSSLNLNLIQKSIEYYQKAMDATIQPEWSDIPTKVHFGLGQAYLMQSYADETSIVAPAIEEFEAVIEAYDNGKNPRVIELAAESYIRLGSIYFAGGYKEYGISLYKNGINLTKQLGNIERSKFFEEQLQEMMNED